MKPTMIRRSRPRPESKKREAERLASDNPHRRSTIVPKPTSVSSKQNGERTPVKATPRKPRKPVKKKNDARRAKNVPRAYGPDERREWTKRQPCIVPGCGRTPCDASHLVSGGTGRKSDAKWTVPFCSSIVATGFRGHHDEYDAGKKSFMAKYFPGIERGALAVACEANWQAACANMSDAFVVREC